MASDSAKANVISGMLIKGNKRDLIAKRICTLEPEEEIKGHGDTVTFIGIADPTVKKYEGKIDYDDLNDGSVSLHIDQQDYVAFTIKDIDKFFDKINKKGTATSRSNELLKNKADAYVLSKYAEAGEIMEVPNCTPKKAINTVVDVAVRLSEKDVPAGEAFFVVSEWFKGHLTKGGIQFQILNGVDDTENGVEFCKRENLDLYASNNIVTTGKQGSRNSKMLAGQYNSIVFADAFTESRYLPLSDKFANGYSALHVYGAKVVDPSKLICVDATEVEDEEV